MLKKIKFSYKEASDQSKTFSPFHTRFKCKIKVDGLQYSFDYQCNLAVTEPNLVDCLRCVLMDAFAYDDMKDYDEYYNEYGGDYKSYKACKKTSKTLHRLFSDAEIEQLDTELEMEEEGY
jgi:hypothetical protein